MARMGQEKLFELPQVRVMLARKLLTRSRELLKQMQAG